MGRNVDGRPEKWRQSRGTGAVQQERDASKNVDLSIDKNFYFAERHYLQLRFETFNTTNRVTFGSPSLSATSSAFGAIATQSNSPRAVQLGARLVW